MYFLDQIDVCLTDNLNPVWDLIGIVIKIIWIGIPILLIVLGSIDLGKAVIASKEDDVKKAKKSLINRFIYAVLVFIVVWLVQLAIGAISTIGIDDADTSSWNCCWKKITSGSAKKVEDTDKCKYEHNK